MHIKLGIGEKDEGRKSSRIKSRFPVVVSSPTGENYNAKTVDISPQGLLLEFANDTRNGTNDEGSIEKSLEQGTSLNVTLNSPFLAHKQASSAITYRVVRATQLASGRLRVGLEIQCNQTETNGGLNVIDPNEYVITSELEVVFLKILEQVNLQLPNKESKVIILTGVEPKSGTATLSWWLASCLSFLANIKVLYVDGNLRPKIIADPDELTSGLLEVLLGQQGLMDTTIEMRRSSLSLLNAGGKDGFLGYEVTESQVESALEIMRENYQYTIIDTLPINSSPLTAMLAKHADGSFIVVETGVNDRNVAHDAAERLRQVGSKIIGAILNKF